MLFVAFITFLATVCILMILVYASGPQVIDMGRRLSRVLRPGVTDREIEASTTGGRRAENVFVTIGKAMPASKAKRLSQDQVLILRAGYRSENAIYAVKGVRLLSCIAAVALVIWTGVSKLNPLVFISLSGFLGWFAPELWLLSRVKARQKRLRLSLPDAMDLLVICVEVGLGLDQALLKVSEEIQLVHPELSYELHLVNLEMRVGKTRLDALRELGQRTGLDDIKALVSILVQTDRFGTSIVQALRTFSDELRTKRRQRAEEMSAKVSVKMVPALVFFIFPALMVVILGPALLTIKHSLLPTLK
jgi:tight adherence protein C